MSKLLHGGYSVSTCFDIKQHKYAAGESGYIEILEILDPHAEKNPYVVCTLQMVENGDKFSFTEFETLAQAIAG
jgi:hypothetical protein